MPDDYKYRDHGLYGRPTTDRAHALALAADHFERASDLRDLVNSIQTDLNGDRVTDNSRIMVGPYRIRLRDLSMILGHATRLCEKELDEVYATKAPGYVAFRHEDTLDERGFPERGPHR